MAAAMAATPQPAPAAGNSGPNLVYVFADQMRFCDMGCAGNEHIRTPNFDRLAGQGLRLSNAYTAAPLCSPYRAQLQTGLYGHANGVPKNGLPMRQDVPTFARAFDSAGYATGYIGKWHLSGQRKARKGKELINGFVPPGEQRAGWNYWAAHEVIHKYMHSEYFRDKPEAISIPGFESDFQTDLAIEFMRQNRARPFSLMLSWGPPHEPYQLPDRAKTYYDPAKMPIRPNVPSEFRDDVRHELTKYYGLITCLDENMGRLMSAISELGIADNTVLVFTSDHGNMIRSQGMRLKQKPWEESAHIPFLIRDPRRIKPGQTSERLFNSIDIMPTMFGMCGLPLPHGLHGIDRSGELMGRKSKDSDSIYLALDSEGSADEGRAAGAGGRWRAVRTRERMYVMREGEDWLLYDVRKDPYQMKNLAEDRSLRNERQELKKLLGTWMERTGDRPWPIA
jgi:arylsulfatase A-like enzyme